ncbi:WhiB family transcriptional regulator [Myceligenerans crystallogenes]|uniref:4Fe-4S Wbl-type domain-containing protein n=1 Tax=Myceligenerans crystallogenes TaxID=316335 RepID=A0ABN2ND02_9MICO
MRIAHALPAAPAPVLRIPTPADDSRPLTIDEAALSLCSQTDPEVWFPEVGQPAREAKRICAACPIAARCLAIALASRPRVEGIWAGTTEHDRARILAARNREARRQAATAALVADDADLGEVA